MRTLLTLSSLAVVVLAGTGCRSHVAGRCDCTNHPESAAIPTVGANYPVLGSGPTVGNSGPIMTSNSPATIVPNGIMGNSTAPATMPSTLPNVPVPMPK